MMSYRPVMLGIAMCVGFRSAIASSLFSSQISSPITLKFVISVKDLRTDSILRAQQDFEAMKARSVQSTTGKPDDALVPRQEALKLRHPFQKFDLTLATDGSNVLVIRESNKVRETGLFTKSQTLVKDRSGGCLVRDGLATAYAPMIPKVCARIGVVELYGAYTAEDGDNPEHRKFGVVLASSSTQQGVLRKRVMMPVVVNGDVTTATGPFTYSVGLAANPITRVSISKVEMIAGQPVATQYVETELFPADGQLLPLRQTTVKLLSIAAPLSDRAFEIGTYLAKGVPTTVSGSPTFYFDPSAGDLKIQAKIRSQQEVNLQSDRLAAKAGASGALAAIFAFVVVMLVVAIGVAIKHRGRS